MKMAILLNGAPTAGKTVQGDEILDFLPDSERIITSTALEEDGHAEKMRKGDMVDDHIVFDSVTSRINSDKHYVFDGFTRTEEQATIFPQKLKEEFRFDVVVMLELNLIDEEVGLTRLFERKKSGVSLNRPDGDRKETFFKRFQRHNEQASSIRSILVHACDHVFILDASKEKEDVSRWIRNLLQLVIDEYLVEQVIQNEDFIGSGIH